MIENLRSAMDKTNRFASDLDKYVDNIPDEKQFLLANALVLRTCGLIEDSILLPIQEYARVNGNQKISKFISKKVEWMNSFDCEKISNLLNEFDQSWWPAIHDKVGQECLSSIDSLKAIRDQIAHGKYNGTGFRVVKSYHQHALKLPPMTSRVIVGH